MREINLRLSICIESLLLAVICLGDMFSTMYFVANGMAVEQNPIMAFFMNYGMGAFAIAKLISFVPFIIVIEIYRKQYEKFVKLASRFAIAAYLIIYISATTMLNV